MNEKDKKEYRFFKGPIQLILIIIAIFIIFPYVTDFLGFDSNITELQTENEELKNTISSLTEDNSVEQTLNYIALGKITEDITGESDPEQLQGWFDENIKPIRNMSIEDTERYIILGQFIEDGIGISDPTDLDAWLIKKGYSKPIIIEPN